MTAVNWSLSADGVVVLTDSLLVTSEGKAAGFVQKVHSLAHLDALVSGRGDGALICDWVTMASQRLLARDFDMLSELAPALIRKIHAGLPVDVTAAWPGTTTIFMWGWSNTAQRFTGYRYKSKDNFERTPLEPIGIAPGFEDDCEPIKATLRSDQVARGLFDALRQQHLEARRKEEKAVGGDAMMTTLTRAAAGPVVAECLRLFRFPDYDEDYAEALDLMNR